MNKKILLPVFCCMSLGLLTQIKGAMGSLSHEKIKNERTDNDYIEQLKFGTFEGKVSLLVDLFGSNPTMFERLMGFLNSKVSEGYGAQSEEVKELKEEVRKTLLRSNSALAILFSYQHPSDKEASQARDKKEYMDYVEQLKFMPDGRVSLLVDLFQTKHDMFDRLMGFLNSKVSEGYGAQSEEVKELKKEIIKKLRLINKRLAKQAKAQPNMQENIECKNR